MNRTAAELQPIQSESRQSSPQIPGILLAVLLCTILAQTTVGAPQKIRVQDRDQAKEFIQQGGKLIGDYGAFQVIETPDVQNVRRKFSDSLEGSDVIELNSKRLNTRAAETRALRNKRGSFSGSRLHLIQFAGPIKPEWRAEIESFGVKVVSYVPNNSYLVRGDTNALAQLQTWANSASAIQWEGEFADDYKIHPGARNIDKFGFPQTPDSNTFAIQLLVDEISNSNTLAVIERLKLDPIKRDFPVLQFRNLIVRVAPESIAEISSQPDVISIQPYHDPDKRDERQAQIIAGNISGSSPSGAGYLAWLASKGFTQEQFTASGFVVDVTDSGIDNGTIAPGHFGLYQNGNPSLAGRVAYNRIEGTPHVGSSGAGCDGHGNLNAHIIAGFNNASAGFPHTDSSGFRYGLGICPFVSVGSSVVFDPDVFTSPNFANLQSKAYQSGARISANSWGNTNNSYTVDAQAFDALVRDAQPTGSTFPTAGNQEMVIVFAAGNRGSSANTVGSPATAKNVISVGASENVRSLNTASGGKSAFGADGCGYADDVADNVNDIAAFSSRGPTSDGRQKPDLVAPGTHITGGVFQNSTLSSGNGVASSCFKASSICALSGGGAAGSTNNFFPLGQQFYTVSSGTSHATPAVAGACALLRQYFINSNLPPPSPAMTKAYLMNSTRYMNGAGGNDNFWSAAQGMGGLNLGTAFDGVPRILRDQNTNDLFTASGQTRVFTARVAQSDKPVRVTLAWTDAPGSTIGNAFNNDLDLVVTVQTNGNSYKGNNFSGQFSVTGGNADFRNNVENISLPAGISGDITVTVTAANINSDGVPNYGTSLDQDFALVIYNATNTTVPLISACGLSVVAESFFPTNGAVDPGEQVAVNLSLKNNGTATASNLTVTLLATNGVTSPSAAQPYGDVLPNGIGVDRPFTFIANGVAGGAISALAQLSDNSGSLGVIQLSIPLGLTTVQSVSFTNAAAISIPDSGKGSPYPSIISVSGSTGTVTKVTAALRGFTHSWPDDVDVLLVGPTGQRVMLMSDCGGGNARSGVWLTFDSDATSAVPDSATVQPGTYKPTNVDATSDNFPSPAPASPFATSLTNFNGANPNGNWSLFVQDDNAMDGGSITQGWSLTITTSNLISSTGAGNSADIAVSSVFNTASNVIGSNVTLAITVSNAGPDPAAFVTVTNLLPAGLTFASAMPSHGNCSQSGGTLHWSPGLLPPGANASLTVELVGASANTFTNQVTATSTTPDTNISNNFAMASIVVMNIPEPLIATNTPPSLAEIAGRVVHAGRMLVITNSAFDSDVPANNLTFSLGQGAHGGASVHPATGVFTWLTTDADAETTNNFTVTVSDDGSPVLSASRSFVVTVVSRPLITGITLTGSWVNVSWTTIPGDTYRLQFTTNLAAPQWIAVPPDVTAAGSTITHTNPFTPGSQHFYRVMLVP
jgi:uncharacterized repeat protein (TIGR01451 family)